MNKPVSFLKRGNDLTVFVNKKSYTINETHPNYNDILANLSSEQEVARLIDVKQTVEQYSNNAVEVKFGEVYYNGQPMHNNITDRVLELVKANLPFEGMVKFLQNILKNPSKRSVEQLFTFLEHKNLPITEDGCFLAYKAVRNDYYSKTAGTLVLLQGITNDEGRIYNAVGQTVECVRNAVDDNPDNHCSDGLHAGAVEYATPGGYFHSNGDKCVVVKINPADCVSVPKDHDCQKLRVCKYTVVAEYDAPLSGNIYTVQDNKVSPVSTNPVYTSNDELYGTRPDGSRYYNVRVGGKFAKKNV